MQLATEIKNSFQLESKKHKLPKFVEKIYNFVDIIPTSQLIRQMNLLGYNVNKKCMWFAKYISPDFYEDEIVCRDMMLSKILKYMSETTQDKPGVYTTYFEDFFEDKPSVILPTNLIRIYKNDLNMLKLDELVSELENQKRDVRDIHQGRDELEYELLKSFSSGYINTNYTRPFLDSLVMNNCRTDKVKIKTISHPFGEIDIILSISDIAMDMKKEDIVEQISYSGYGIYIVGNEDIKHMSKILMILLQEGFMINILEPLKSLLSTKVLKTYMGRSGLNSYYDTYDIDSMRSLINA